LPNKINISQENVGIFKARDELGKVLGLCFVLYSLLSIKYGIIRSAKVLPDPELQQCQN